MNIQDQLRKKYAQLQGNNSGDKSNEDFLKKFMQLDMGETEVRILPAQDSDRDLFYAETAIHRIQDKNIHCPRKKDEKCPICDLYFKVWDHIKTIGRDNPEAKPFIQFARSIRAGERYYVNAIDRKSGDVKILSVGKGLFTKFMDTIFDEDYGDITDLQEGFDFKITKEMKSTSMGNFPNYDKSKPKPRCTPAGSDAEIREWMDSLHDIHGLVKLKEYDELKTMADSLEETIFPKTAMSPDAAESFDSESSILDDDLGDYM